VTLTGDRAAIVKVKERSMLDGVNGAAVAFSAVAVGLAALLVLRIRDRRRGR
jgi:hypothetical protein